MSEIAELIEALEDAMSEVGDVDVRGNAVREYGYVEEGDVDGVAIRDEEVFIQVS